MQLTDSHARAHAALERTEQVLERGELFPKTRRDQTSTTVHNFLIYTQSGMKNLPNVNSKYLDG